LDVGLNPRFNSNGGGANGGKVWVERFERLWWVEFFGILHCVQDDSRNLQRQVQMQRQVFGWGCDGLVEKRISPLRCSRKA
jgi:hypothetical protein